MTTLKSIDLDKITALFVGGHRIAVERGSVKYFVSEGRWHVDADAYIGVDEKRAARDEGRVAKSARTYRFGLGSIDGVETEIEL